MTSSVQHRLGQEARAEMKDAQLHLRQNVKSPQWRSMVAVIGLVIAGYFVSSLALTFFQKSLISHLRFPMTIVTCHLVLKFCLAALSRQIMMSSCWSGKPKPSRVVLSWRDYLSRVAFVAFFSALDIGFSQWSFEFITVSLYTMTKTTAVLFILMFALIFKLEKKHWSLIVIVSMISLGLFLFVYRSTTFHVFGFLLAFSASLFSGARWTLSQLVMQKSRLGLENPIDLIFHIQPLMVLTLLPFAAGFEGVPFAASIHGFRFHEYEVLFTTIGLVLFGGALAFVMEVFEFFIVTKASSLTLSIVGITKEVVTILLDVSINGNELSAINVVGVIICITGIGIHVAKKATTVTAESTDEDQAPPRTSTWNRRGNNGIKSEMSLPLLSEDDSDELSTDEDDLFYPRNPGGTSIHKSATDSMLGSKKRRYRDFDDNFFLQDNRQWTSVKDSHIRMSQRDDLERTGDIPEVLKEEGKPEKKLGRSEEAEGILLDIKLSAD